MFQTHQHPAHIEGLKDFIDNKGEKDVGLGIQLSMTFGPEVLDQFEPKLREALYRAADTISAQRAGENGEPANAPVRKFPHIKKISWGNAMIGARVEIFSSSLMGDEHVVLADCTLDRFKFELMERSVEVRFRLKAHPDAEGVGSLYESRTSTIEVTITPPEAATYEAKPEKDPRQRDLVSDDLEGDDPDTIPVTAPAKRGRKPGGAKKPGKKPAAKKKRTSRAFAGAALDGTGDTDPFAAPAGGLQ